MDYKIGDRLCWESSVGNATGIVEEIIAEGFIPQINVEILATTDNKGYLLRLDNQSLVGKLNKDLRIEQPVEQQQYPVLTKQQIDKLVQFVPTGFSYPNSSNLTTVKFVVADNLVNRSKGKWIEKDLITMAQMLDTLGLPHTSDHDWENLAKTQGIIIEGEVVKQSLAPTDLISAAGNRKINTDVVKNEEFIQVVATVVFPVDSLIVQKLSMGIGRAVSLGGFAFADYLCPICNVSFSHKNCPHYIPGSWEAWSEDSSLVAPYYVRDGLYDIGELSSVLIGNLPGASCVTGVGSSH